MNLLFDLGHPAHVHLFRNFILYLHSKGHEVTVTAREKDITTVLLAHYNIPYTSLSKPKHGYLGMLEELASRDFQVLKLHGTKKFDAAFGTSVSIAHLSALTKVKSFCFSDDDDDVIPLYVNITYPFTTKILNPTGLRCKKWLDKRIFYNSYQKLAYLHPDNFTPNEKVLEKYHLQPKKYILIRNSALKAHHDKNAKGIGTRLWTEIQHLLTNFQIVQSKEGVGSKIEPWDMHHILAYSKMLITDSQSMTVEAAVLGVPNIRYNSFAGKISCLEELEHKYCLTYGYKPGEEHQLKTKVAELLEQNDLDTAWQKKRTSMLSDKIDFNQWLIDYFEREINK